MVGLLYKYVKNVKDFRAMSMHWVDKVSTLLQQRQESAIYHTDTNSLLKNHRSLNCIDRRILYFHGTQLFDISTKLSLSDKYATILYIINYIETYLKHLRYR